jgi:hypothetical protein
MMQTFPENFSRLHDGEEFLRSKSIDAIERSEDLLAHGHVIERAMDLIDYCCHQHLARNDDELTIQLLGIRMFNASASAIKLLLSGYYQVSALQQRDLLETIFLLDYFTTNRALISAWRQADEQARRRNFGLVIIRKALDDRDGFMERKREKAYKLLCELAGHPTYTGFRMLAPKPGGDAHCGPFFEFTTLKAVYEELARLLVQAGAMIMQFFPDGRKHDREMKTSFMKAQAHWAEKFYGHPSNQAKIK